MTRRPALDGLRALAVAGVLVYHGGAGVLPGGFLGVDIFFVLSGFLITSLLLAEHAEWGSLDLLTFWRRRARRLLPALFLVLAAVVVYAAAWGAADRRGAVRWDAISTLLYVANWRFAFSGQSYFDQYAEPSPLLHTWSLAIEEQFYVLYPLLLLALLFVVKGRSRPLGAALAGLAILSAVFMAASYSPSTDPSRIYYGTDARAQELLVGAVLAALTTTWWRRPDRAMPAVRRRVLDAAAAAALAGLVLMMVATTERSAWLYRGGFLVVAVVALVVIAAAAYSTDSWTARLLAWRPFVLVGLVSYGLYLWHWPVFLALSPSRTSMHGPALFGLRVVVTAALATASFVLVERPIRNGALTRIRWSGGRVVMAAAIAGVASLIVVALPSSASTLDPSLVAVTGPAPGKARILVVGDSVALSLAIYARDAMPTTTDVRAETLLGCGLGSQELSVGGRVGPANPACEGTVDRWSRAVERYDPQVVVVDTAAWDVLDHVVAGRVLQVGTPEYASHLRAELEAALPALTSGGAKVVLLTAPCSDTRSEDTLFLDFSRDRNDPARHDAVNEIYRAFGRAHTDEVTVAPIESVLCPDGVYTREVAGEVARDDGVHFTRAGSALVWRWLLTKGYVPSGP